MSSGGEDNYIFSIVVKSHSHYEFRRTPSLKSQELLNEISPGLFFTFQSY